MNKKSILAYVHRPVSTHASPPAPSSPSRTTAAPAAPTLEPELQLSLEPESPSSATATAPTLVPPEPETIPDRSHPRSPSIAPEPSSDVSYLQQQDETEAWSETLLLQQTGEACVRTQALISHRYDPSKAPIVQDVRKWATQPPPSTKAARELPFTTITDEQYDAAHGVSNNHIPEDPHIAMMQPLDITNNPAIRDPPSRTKPQAPKQLPKRGSYNDLFQEFTFTSADHGQWVRTRLQQLGLARGGRESPWILHEDDFEREITLWFATTAQDLVNAKEWKRQGSHGKFRPKSSMWIIPELAFKKWPGTGTFRTHTAYALHDQIAYNTGILVPFGTST